MKVLHILFSLKYSGAEIMYTDAASLFENMGCKLGVVATSEDLGEYAPAMEKAGYEIFHMPYPNSYFKRFIYYIHLCQLIKREKYDIIHIHTTRLRWGGSLCAWLTGRRCVYTFHNVFPTHWYSRAWHVYLRWTAKHIFKARFQSISDSVYENEEKLFLNDTHLIYNWYGSNRFFPAKDDEKNSVRNEMGIGTDTIVVVSVGGCRPEKQHSDIIHAVKMLVDKNVPVLYLHVGDGELEENEKQLAQELGIAEHVMFCGAQHNVRNYLIASDIYLMPSHFEGISISAIEAMACRIPCILYDVLGLHDYNNEAECSILIPESVDILTEKIMLLAGDKALQKKLTDNAERLVNRKYSMEHNARQILNLYK